MSLRILSTVVTRMLLMEGGLGLLAKFKIIPDNTDEAAVQGAISTLETQSTTIWPSWVIDWQLTSTMFGRRDITEPAEIYISGLTDCELHQHLKLGSPPRAHELFCQDNSREPDADDSLFVMDHLVVRGRISEQFCVKGKHVLVNVSSFKWPSFPGQALGDVA